MATTGELFGDERFWHRVEKGPVVNSTMSLKKIFTAARSGGTQWIKAYKG